MVVALITVGFVAFSFGFFTAAILAASKNEEQFIMTFTPPPQKKNHLRRIK